MLSTESPPFNPSSSMMRMLGSNNNNGSDSSSQPQSGANSPVVHMSRGISENGNETHSNAVPRHSFQGPNG